jgi:hypothetical protein
VLQWYRTGESPLDLYKINSLSDKQGVGMTVPVQAPPSPRQTADRTTQMSMLQPPRSRFMINDILSGGATNGLIGHHAGYHHPHHHHLGGLMGGHHHHDEDGRSPSPQGPRDLSVAPGGRHDDSDSDSSGGLDDQSDGCSTGE